MSDQVWAVVAGALAMVLIRLLDWILPRGHHFKWVRKYGTRSRARPLRTFQKDSEDDSDRESK